MKIDHLSATQINMFKRCGQQYYYRYCEGLKCPPRAALTLGSSFHFGLAINYGQKVASRQDLPLGDVLDAYSARFEDMAEDTEWQQENPAKVKDSGIATLKTYQEQVAPEIQPSEVERQFKLSFKHVPWTFTGYMDVLDENMVIVEAKTTSRSLSEPQPDHVLQVTGYAAGLLATTGVKQTARIDYAVKKKEPAICTFRVLIDDKKVDFFLTVMGRVAQGIENEIWVPNRNSNLCSEKWCGYWHRCQKDIGG